MAQQILTILEPDPCRREPSAEGVLEVMDPQTRETNRNACPLPTRVQNPLNRTVPVREHVSCVSTTAAFDNRLGHPIADHQPLVPVLDLTAGDDEDRGAQLRHF